MLKIYIHMTFKNHLIKEKREKLINYQGFVFIKVTLSFVHREKAMDLD